MYRRLIKKGRGIYFSTPSQRCQILIYSNSVNYESYENCVSYASYDYCGNCDLRVAYTRQRAVPTPMFAPAVARFECRYWLP